MLLYHGDPQSPQVPPLGPVYPGLHKHNAAAVLPVDDELEFAGHVMQVATLVAPTVVEYVPYVQSVHAVEPVVLLYFPAVQAVHAPPSGPVKPKLQVQLASAVHPLHEAPVLAGQTVHVPPFGP